MDIILPLSVMYNTNRQIIRAIAYNMPVHLSKHKESLLINYAACVDEIMHRALSELVAARVDPPKPQQMS